MGAEREGAVSGAGRKFFGRDMWSHKGGGLIQIPPMAAMKRTAVPVAVAFALIMIMPDLCFAQGAPKQADKSHEKMSLEGSELMAFGQRQYEQGLKDGRTEVYEKTDAEIILLERDRDERKKYEACLRQIRTAALYGGTGALADIRAAVFTCTAGWP